MELHLDTDIGGDCDGLDALAVAVALGWDGVTVETLPLAHDADGEHLRLRVDRGRFAALWLGALAGRPAPDSEEA
jgi:hypothetical protein